MELPQVGQHCSQNHCNKLDFLPLQCKCGKIFCSDHLNLHSASCETSNKDPTPLKKVSDVYRCTQPDCKEISIVPLLCDKCKQHFCIKHRHVVGCFEKDPDVIAKEKEKYHAPVRQFNEAKNVVDKEITSNLNQAIKKGKNKETAEKIKLMKLKGKATGAKTIPTADRVYFGVKSPKGEVPVFVSKTWTLGRVIDAVAEECKLQNHNNKSGEKKLRLFKEAGDILFQDMSVNLEQLLNNSVIHNGENLILAYVDS